MAKEWKAGDRIPVAYVNELEKRVEQLTRQLKEQEKPAERQQKEQG
ncbi:MAG: hypothetical protein LBD12_02000 [Clostridiales Family XIII bacterium]|jgi:hypothetical protein|nr:hypothetical protein [Clostridiales Family XIII bacterium]